MPPSSRFLRLFVFLSLAVALAGVMQFRWVQANEHPLKPLFEKTKIDPKRIDRYGKLPLLFEANAGQTDPSVKFLSRTGSAALFLTADEAVMRFSADSSLVMRLIGAQASPRLEGLVPTETRNHYFLGNDPARWRTGVRTFSRVKYTDVYPGVDLVWHGEQQRLEHDFVLAPGADPRRIRFELEGAKKLAIAGAGDLQVMLAGGEARFLKPVAWQEEHGKRTPVVCDFSLGKRGRIGFRLGAYDRRKPLVIDPILIYSTYLGGTRDDWGYDIALDDEGNAYVVGETGSMDFPGPSPIQAANSGQNDAFLIKINSSGTAVIFAAWLGGTRNDFAGRVALGSDGSIYLAGTTSSTNFPLKNPFQSTLGGLIDVFVAKLDSSGSTLLYSTFLGGEGFESLGGAAPDREGNLYVADSTDSVEFPTLNPLQAVKSGGGGSPANQGLIDLNIRSIATNPASAISGFLRAQAAIDAFLCKINPTGSALIFSTYFGGGGVDLVEDMTIDAAGAVYIAGGTNSVNFPTINPVQATLAGDSDGFISKFGADGSGPVWSTYLGGTKLDYLTGVAVNASGEVYLSGVTLSNDFPLVAPVQRELKGEQDAFVLKLGNDGAKLDFSTYLGGTGVEYAYDLALDSAGDVYVVGSTASLDFPVVNAVQSTRGGAPALPIADAFAVKMNAIGTSVLYATYLGGDFSESAQSVAIDAEGNAYLTGQAASDNFPTTPNVLGPRRAGIRDAFIAKIGINADLELSAIDQPDPAQLNNPLTITLRVRNKGADAARNVRLSHTLPAGVAFLSATTTQGSCSGTSPILCDLGEIPTNVVVSVAVTLTPNTTGTISNAASVTSATPDIDPANNAVTVETRISAAPSVFGRIVTATGEGIAGVNVALIGAARPPVVTGVDGLYQFAELGAGADYAVSPSREGLVFDPPSRNFTNLTTDQRGDFTVVGCGFSLSASNQSFPAVGGETTINLTAADPQCPWTVENIPSWITVLTPTSGKGSGSVRFSVAPSLGSRSAIVRIAGLAFTARQEFNACPTLALTGAPEFRLPPGDYRRQFLVRDLNRDGRGDLLLTVGDVNLAVMIAFGAPGGGFGQLLPVLDRQTTNAFFSAIDAADLNGDGALDLIVAGEDASGGRVFVLQNDGAGGFASPKNFPSGSSAGRIAIADFNRDGKLDLALVQTGSLSGPVILLNDGSGGLGAARSFPPPPMFFGHPDGINAGDLNGDGNIDLFLAGFVGIQPYYGDGAGTFGAQPVRNFPTSNLRGFGDFNGDGRPDALVLQSQGDSAVYLNDGQGQYPAPIVFPYAVSQGISAELLTEDFNGDGKADVLIKYPDIGELHLFLALGAGRFASPSISTTFGDFFRSATGDYNNDGRLDLFAFRFDGLIKIALGNGGGFDGPRGYQSATNPIAIGSADFNRDGLLDLAVAGPGTQGARLLFGNGRGGFGEPTLPVPVSPANITTLEIRDFNRDQNLDLALQSAESSTISIMLGDGRGGFRAGATVNTGSDAKSFSVADFNRDGALDLIVKGQAGGLAIFSGNGQGDFSPTAAGIGGPMDRFSFVVGDFNGDQSPDLALSDDAQVMEQAGYKITLLPGDGRGGFGSAVPISTESRQPTLFAADLDLDGRDDLLSFSDFSGGVFVALANQTGGFNPEIRYVFPGAVRSLLIRDFNGDARPDLVVLGQQQQEFAFFAGRGDGGFQPAAALPFASKPQIAATGDFDQDGTLDFAFANLNSSTVSVALNPNSCPPAGSLVATTAGSFSRSTLAPGSIASIFGVNLATGAESAVSLTLPTTLANSSLWIKDSMGMERLAGLFYASPTQINFLVPAEAAPGAASAAVISSGVTVATGPLLITPIRPDLFTADSSGRGLAAAVALRVKSDDSQTTEAIVRFDPQQNKLVPIPIDLGDEREKVFIILFGTGFRRSTALSQTSVKIGGENAAINYAGAQGSLVGLDQVNALLPRTLIGRGEVEVIMTVNGSASNVVTLTIK